MKINNEQLHALQETKARSAPSPAQEGFTDILAQEIATNTAQGLTSSMDAQKLLHSVLPASLLGTAATQAPGGLQGTEAEMADRMEGMFTGMDNYARQLASGDQTSLRGAYSQLEQVNAEIASFRAAFPEMESEQPELAAMINELEAVTYTETFKFNRGDYL